MLLWGFIIALIALGIAMLAVPPFLAIVYGQPQIKLQYRFDKGEGEFDFLGCLITNEPIHNRLLKRLKVERQTAEDVYVYLSIMSLKDNTLIIERINPKIFTPRNPDNMQGVLPRLSTSFPAQFMVAAISDGGVTTTPPYGGAKKTKRLPPGRYLASLEIHQASDKVFLFTNTFYVGAKRRETYWEETKPSL
jgi:hypothetical protein